MIKIESMQKYGGVGMDNKISIGNAGEYFVAGELERRGFTVALPMSNVKERMDA